MANKKKVTMSQVAEIAGVSKATVSRALGGSSLIGPAVRAQVEQVANELGYVRKSQKRHAERSILTVKLVLPASELTSMQLFYSFMALISGLREGLQPTTANVLVETDRPDFEPFPHKKGGEIDAFVFAFHRPSRQVLAAIEAQGAACVVMNRVVRGIRHVVSDHEDAFRKIATHLAARGVRGNCCFVSYRGIREVVQARLQGFTDACADLGIAFDPETDRWHVDTPHEITLQGVRELYEKGVRTFMGVNDVAAVILFQHIREMGLSVPEDVRVTGCDRGPVHEITHPKLTTVDLSVRKLAKAVGQSLQEEVVQKMKARRSLKIGGELVIGETT